MNLGYKVYFESIDDRAINFLVSFEHPDSVSRSNENNDMMIVTIIDESFFSIIDKPALIKSGTEFTLTLPKLLIDDETAELLKISELALS